MTIFYSLDFKTFNPEKHFQDFHYWEELKDENEKISANKFIKDYGQGIQMYICEKFQISDSSDNNNNKTRTFIVAQTVLSDEERKELIPHCYCPFHKLPKWFWILERLIDVLFVGLFLISINRTPDIYHEKGFWTATLSWLSFIPITCIVWFRFLRHLVYCKCCYGCLETFTASQHLINKARKEVLKLKQN